MKYKDLIRLCHVRAKRRGWWSKPRNMGECVALIHSELVEANIGWKTRKMDKHLPQYRNQDVELADTYIRSADLLGYLGQIEYDPNGIPKETHQELYSWSETILQLHEFASEVLESFRKDNLKRASCYLWAILILITRLSRKQQFDLVNLINEKLDYNDQRADHKLENRNKPGGKKF